MLHARGVILQAHANSVCLLDHMPVGNDISLAVDDHARSQRVLANRPAVVGIAEKLVEKIPKWIVFVIPLSGATAHERLDGRVGVDVDHRRFQRLGDLRELIRELAGRRYAQRGRVRGLSFLSSHMPGDHGPDQDANRQGQQNHQRKSQPVGFKTPPQSVHFELHRTVASAFQAFDYNVTKQTTSESNRELLMLDAGLTKSVVEIRSRDVCRHNCRSQRKSQKRRGKRRHRETDSGGRVLPYRLSWAKWKGRKPSVDCASRHCVPDLKRLNRSTTLAIAPSIERRARPQQEKEKLGLDPPRHPDCSPRQVDGTTSRTKHSGPTPRLSTCDARRAPPSLTYPRFAPY